MTKKRKLKQEPTLFPPPALLPGDYSLARRQLDLTQQEMANVLQITLDDYRRIEGRRIDLVITRTPGALPKATHTNYDRVMDLVVSIALARQPKPNRSTQRSQAH